jgi:hypothetical protein
VESDITAISEINPWFTKKTGNDHDVPALIVSDISHQAFRKNGARLIQKINVDNNTCFSYPDGYCLR